MRLLIVSTSPVGGDGRQAAGAFAADLVDALEADGHDCAVVCPAAAEVESDVASATVTPTRYTFATDGRPLSLLSPRRLRDWPAIASTLLAGQRAVDRAADAFAPTHVLALWALPSGFWARRAARRHRVPYAVWALGSDIWSLGRLPLVRTVLAGVLRDAAARFADGYALGDDVRRIAAADCRFLASVRRLPSPPPEPAPGDGARRRLLYLGRWHTNKGVDLLLDALERLDGDDWRNVEEVRIAGGGPLETAVRERVARLAEAGRPCTALGYVDRSAATALYAWSDHVLLPSRVESIPLVFSDAVRSGRALVATPVGDLPALLARYRCGVLAPSIDGAGLVTALRETLARPADSWREGIAAAAADFDVAASARELVRALDDSTSSRAPAPGALPPRPVD